MDDTSRVSRVPQSSNPDRRTFRPQTLEIPARHRVKINLSIMMMRLNRKLMIKILKKVKTRTRTLAMTKQFPQKHLKKLKLVAS